MRNKINMAQGSFKKSAGSLKVKGKAGKASVAAKSKRVVNKGKTAVKKGCEYKVLWYSSNSYMVCLQPMQCRRARNNEGVDTKG